MRRDFDGVKAITTELLEMKDIDSKQWTTAAAVLYLQAAFETSSLQEAREVLLGNDGNSKSLESDVVIVWYENEACFNGMHIYIYITLYLPCEKVIERFSCEIAVLKGRAT